MSILILNNNTIMKNGVVFKVPGDTSNRIDKNGNVCSGWCSGEDIEDGPLSVEEVIDNIKEESL